MPDTQIIGLLSKQFKVPEMKIHRWFNIAGRKSMLRQDFFVKCRHKLKVFMKKCRTTDEVKKFKLKLFNSMNAVEKLVFQKYAIQKSQVVIINLCD